MVGQSYCSRRRTPSLAGPSRGARTPFGTRGTHAQFPTPPLRLDFRRVFDPETQEETELSCANVANLGARFAGLSLGNSSHISIRCPDAAGATAGTPSTEIGVRV